MGIIASLISVAVGTVVGVMVESFPIGLASSFLLLQVLFRVLPMPFDSWLQRAGLEAQRERLGALDYSVPTAGLQKVSVLVSDGNIYNTARARAFRAESNDYLVDLKSGLTLACIASALSLAALIVKEQFAQSATAAGHASKDGLAVALMYLLYGIALYVVGVAAVFIYLSKRNEKFINNVTS